MLLEELLKIRPANPEMVEKHQKRMLDEIHAYKLREQQKNTDLPQSHSREYIDADRQSVPQRLAPL